jgi:Tol biopolymer transport system component
VTWGLVIGVASAVAAYARPTLASVTRSAPADAGGSCMAWDPAWSPNGLQIAFGGSTSGLIEAVDPAGTRVSVLTSVPVVGLPGSADVSFHHDFQPVWSHDGRRLAYASDWQSINGGRTWDQWSLSVLNLTTRLVRLVGGGAGPSRADPTWSRNGILAYDLFDGPYLDPSGFVTGARTYMSTTPDSYWSQPSWAPGGDRFAFMVVNAINGESRIFVMRPAYGTYRLLARGRDPHWSPDGRWIAYEAGGGVSIRSADGKRLRWLRAGGGFHGSIVWSPGGARLALGTRVATVATGSVRQLPIRHHGDYPGPSWSPDGRWLVYASDVLEIVHPDGTGYHTIDPCTQQPRRERAGASRRLPRRVRSLVGSSSR